MRSWIANPQPVHREKGEERLREAVKRLDERLWHQLEEVWRLAEEGIHDAQRSKDGHQQGTPHCRAVEENLAALIPDDWKGTRFTALDLFVLSGAAALHDVGKAGDSPDDHGHVSMWEVRTRAMTFGLDEGQAEVVGWIVRAHNDGDLEALPAGPYRLGTADIESRPLAALFKLADALHTDYRRVSRQVVGFGGRRPEDSPKTRFRLRVRGWGFDDQGRIELYAVPKDWDDVDVINTGFEMTCQGLEPVIPTLRDADFPWELTLHLDETDLEHKADQEMKAERAFVGMEYFTEADAPRFKGRDDDAQALWHRVTALPVTLLVGDSGVGKTSLIHAGLLPLLHRARWRTSCTRPFDDADRFVVRDLWRDLLDGEPPTGITIVETLEKACKAVGDCRLLVVLDQFEDVIHAPLPGALDGLRKALVAVQARRFRNLRLLVSYRADAEATLGPLFLGVAGSDRGLPRTYLQPLDRDGARAALDAGLTEAQVGVSDTLLDVIADNLEAQTPTPGVYPPYVQMVGETLCRAAREENEGILTEELYRAKGGCQEIIGRYLVRRLEEFGEQKEAAQRVLVALVRSTGVKGQRSLEELQAEIRLDGELLVPPLDRLVDERMIRHLGGGQYEIVHDHLACLVNQEIVGPEERRLKELQEFLDLKARIYATDHIPLQPPDMARLYAVREQISPNDDQMRLLLHSCLLERGPAWFWLRDAQQARYAPLLRDALTRPHPSLRRNAVSILAQVAGREAIPDLRALLKDEDWRVRQAAAEALVQMAGREAIPDLRALLKDEDWRVRQAAAVALAQVAGRQATSDLRALLKDEDGRMRQAAAVALAQVAGREALPDLRALLKDKYESVRGAAAEALAQVLRQAGREALPDLRALLKDYEDWLVQRAAAKALVQVLRQAGREDIPDLRALLKDGDWNVRQAAAEALAQVAGREAIPDLRALLKDKHGLAREAAVVPLVQVAGREAIPDLRALLKDEDWPVRQAAAKALAQVARREAIADLRALLKDEDRPVRRAAAKALAQVLRLAGWEAIPDLRALLKYYEDWHVQMTAVEALTQVLQQAGREDIPDLRALLKDEDWSVQQAAAKALAQVLRQAGREAIPDLRALLKDEDGRARAAATEALAQVAGREAIADLRALLKDVDGSVRWAATEALAQVAGREAIPDLRALLKDKDGRVQQAAAEALEELVTEDDLAWLAEWVASYPLTEAGEAANHLLIHLDRELFCPIEGLAGQR